MENSLRRIYNKDSEILMKKADDCIYNSLEKLPLEV